MIHKMGSDWSSTASSAAQTGKVQAQNGEIPGSAAAAGGGSLRTGFLTSLSIIHIYRDINLLVLVVPGAHKENKEMSCERAAWEPLSSGAGGVGCHLWSLVLAVSYSQNP